MHEISHRVLPTSLQALFLSLATSRESVCTFCTQLHCTQTLPLALWKLFYILSFAPWKPSIQLHKCRTIRYVSTTTPHVISPFPEEQYSFSTLWGMYVSGDTQKLQVNTVTHSSVANTPMCYSSLCKPILPDATSRLSAAPASYDRGHYLREDSVCRARSPRER